MGHQLCPPRVRRNPRSAAAEMNRHATGGVVPAKMFLDFDMPLFQPVCESAEWE